MGGFQIKVLNILSEERNLCHDEVVILFLTKELIVFARIISNIMDNKVKHNNGNDHFEVIWSAQILTSIDVRNKAYIH